MLYVAWQNGSNPGKVHFASRLVRTLCGRQIPGTAKEIKKPRDKSKLCKKCVALEEEWQRYENLFS
jgi:hypothetical protein